MFVVSRQPERRTESVMAGGIHRLRYGSGTENVTDVNAAFLPSRITVEGAGSVL